MFPKRFSRDIEKKWQRFWEENGIHRFDLNDDSRPIYSIDTPPPFTSGELHMGHVLSYSFFDFAARYKRMQGYNVYYPQGWDCQGFPTEVKVEKKYGRLPRKEFVEKCVEWTNEYISKMKTQMIALGFSPDWRYEYKTIDPEYHKKVQLSLIEMYKSGQIYRKKHPVYWCTRCMSAIAKAELNDIETTGQIHTIVFSTESGKELRIATTRPELLPACVAVAIHPDDERYSSIGDKFVLTPLGAKVPLIRDKDVDKDFGTGVVMICTFGDKQDVIWASRYNLQIRIIITENGKIVDSGIEGLDGLSLSGARKFIVDYLRKSGKLLESKDIKHTVKVHDRCNTPIELLPSMQWFADLLSYRERIKDMAKRIKWIPDFGISYLYNWVDNLEWDWVISRQRYFGTPLPFYYCPNCGDVVPASEDELPFYPENARHIQCEKCGSPMKPEEATCDGWVDSSITPLVISGWPDDDEMFNKVYPNTLRPQGVEIVRTWAFYTIYRSGVCITGVPPWKEILLNGNVLAPDSRKMSKSLGNVISPSKLLNEYPADALRQWSAMSGAMAKDRPFSYEDIKYARNFLTKLWNAARFIYMFALGGKGITSLDYTGELTQVDIWALRRVDEVSKSVTKHMEGYEYHKAIHIIHDFFWHEFCDDYLEFVKYRIRDNISKDAVIHTLSYVLLRILILLFPFCPHITEEIYNIVFNRHNTITKESWPREFRYLDTEVSDDVALIRDAVHQIRKYKASNGIPQGKEVKEVCVKLPSELSEYALNEIKHICVVFDVSVEICNKENA